jgi:DNA-binding MarR family transcriptional regulator
MKPPTTKPGSNPVSSAFELEFFLPYRLSLLSNLVSDGIARHYRDEFDISVTEWRILAVLGRFPGLSASEITDRTAMDKVAISRAVKCLEHKAMLQRKTDPADRRRMRLYLTSRPGQQTLRKIIPLARRYEAELLGALSPKEQEALASTLDKLQEKAQALNNI